jgi:iron(III) transport system ATP-binding protein
MAKIRLESVSKAYGRHRVIDNLSITIPDGECFTFLGPSGCGKTVVLRLIAGFEEIGGGEIFIGDRLVSSSQKKRHLPPEQRRIGVVFQDYAVWPHKSVFQNVIYPLIMQQLPIAEANERTREAIRQVNMDGLEHRMPFQLSGGQQQRVALARALVSGPEVMLLDEPLSNLDANLREEMRFEITELRKKTGVTILYVTHDQEVALAISDRIAVMDPKGFVRQIGTPDEIYEQPADSFVFRFMGISNFLPLSLRNGNVCIGDSDAILDREIPPDKLDRIRTGKAIAGCRPYDILLTRDKTTACGILKRIIYLGPILDYRVTVGSLEIRVQQDIEDALSEGLHLREGDAVGLRFLDLKWFDNHDSAPEVR